VSSSVEGLSPDNVTIVDSKGNVLNAPSMAEIGGDVTDRFEMQWLYEQQLEKSIVAMLERIYGYGNVITRVNATLDFAYLEEYSEVFTPINRDEGLVRSHQSSEESYRGTTSGVGGVPGVESNVPGYVFAENDGDSVEWERSEGTTNYELNRKETRSTVLPGGVRNINVSVWINGDLDPTQLESIQESVTQVTGLRVNRGDSIYVASVPFETSPFLGEEITPDVVHGIPLHWVLALVLIFILITVALVVRARRVRIQEETLAASLDIVVDDEEPLFEEELTEEEKERRNIRKTIMELAKEKPEEVALLMKTWLIDE
ncbi:MAG TPA: flagellar M-ring protein FliF, partial [Natronincola sp.]|nr:flagellar M-ring protein FliF [Natronincola sp.]